MRGSFNARKFGELAFKTVFMDGKGVSVQRPGKERRGGVRGREVPGAIHGVYDSIVGSEGEDADAGKGNPEEVPQGERAETDAGGAGGAGVGGDFRQWPCVYVGCLFHMQGGGRFVSEIDEWGKQIERGRFQRAVII